MPDMSFQCKSFSSLENEIANCHLAQERAVALLPLGCVEQHGPFLPIETDSLIAWHCAKRIAGRLSEKKFYPFIYPAINYSPSRSNIGYCGTVSISEDSLRAYLGDICLSLLDSPFDIVTIIGAHGPAKPSIEEIIFKIVNDQFRYKKDRYKPIINLSVFENSAQITAKFGVAPGRHADWRELLFLFEVLGENVFTEEKVAEILQFSKEYSLETEKNIPLGIPIEYRSVKGVMGKPFVGTVDEVGSLSKMMWDLQLNYLVDVFVRQVSAFDILIKEKRT